MSNITATVKPYIGRFAPSPTGPLHMGSLLSAVASYLDAKANKGKWLLRIEDIDPPREIKGSSHAIIASLRAHGLNWDGHILWQHDQYNYYRDCLADLAKKHLVYACDCSRAQINNGIYSGRCRERKAAPLPPFALRLKTTATDMEFIDAIQGPYRQNITTQTGDFILWRKDELPAYQLAVVADDAYQNITHIIRGSDLLDSTPRQIYLAKALQFNRAEYGHLPVLVNNEGQKLSKQHHANPIDDSTPLDNIYHALQKLGQVLPIERPKMVAELLTWAIDNWDLKAVPQQMSLPQS
ncbi:MAG: glutamyl-Q tRNA(Asp) synthetase [Pseudomonadales bacterium]